MQHVNWWLMALAFLLGLALTSVLMIRRVKREVPEYAGAGATAAGATRLEGATNLKSNTAEEETGAAAAGGAGAATAVAAIADVPAGRHGPGSATPEADGSGPKGWAVKGNEDSMLYHTTESPSYKRTKAEVWFFDEATAEAAGFNRWDSAKSQRGET
jgi:hypothetical protein